MGAHAVDGTRGLRFKRVSLALTAAVEAQGIVLTLVIHGMVKTAFGHRRLVLRISKLSIMSAHAG